MDYICAIFLMRSSFCSSMSLASTGISVIALLVASCGWWWTPVPQQVASTAVEPQTAPASEIACSCSCPATYIPSVALHSGAFDWKSFCIVILAAGWALSLFLCRGRQIASTPEEVFFSPFVSHGGYAAIDEGGGSTASHRAVHVRGLRRGRGTLA
jgi:hypothetical protein